MLDSVIHKHVDALDEIETDMSKELDILFNQIDIELLVANTSGVLEQFTNDVKSLLIDRYAPRAVEEGVKFAQVVEKLKRDIVIEDTDNPHLNKGEIVDKGPD